MNAVWREFERGFMILFAPHKVFAVQMDENAEVSWWDDFVEAWALGGRRVYPSEPQGGLGWVWHGHVEVRTRLGGTTSPEIPGEGEYRRSNGGWIIAGLDGEPLSLEGEGGRNKMDGLELIGGPTFDPRLLLVLPSRRKVNLAWCVFDEPIGDGSHLTMALPSGAETLPDGRTIVVLERVTWELDEADAAALLER